MKIEGHTEKLYYIAYGDEVIHCGELGVDMVLNTGQPNLEQFNNEQEWKSRLDELGYVFPESVLPLSE